MTYDKSRLANYGRDVGTLYGRFARAEKRMVGAINEALESGIPPREVAQTLLGRATSRQAMLDLVVVLKAATRMEKIPPEVLEAFDKGVLPKRI